MSIVRWNPLGEIAALHDDMNRLFSRLNGVDGGTTGGHQSWMLPLDVYESKDMLNIKAALPGIDPKDVNIEVDGDVLSISGQRRFEEKVAQGDYCWIEQQYGSFNRSLTLPVYVDSTKIDANFNNGMLELRIPKREEAKPRRIELKIGGQNGSAPAALEAGPSESNSGSPQTANVTT